MNTLSTHQEFDRLHDIIAAGDWGQADPWRGADVALFAARFFVESVLNRR